MASKEVAGSIADHVAKSLTAFTAINTVGARTRLSDSQIASAETISDQLSRFKLWAGNIGAHRTGHSSLDYRLRDSSHLHAQVIKLLDDLTTSLNEVHSILSGETLPWEQDLGEMDGLDEELRDLLLNESFEFNSELDQLSKEIADTISNLLRLSMSLRNPAPHDRFMSTEYAKVRYFEANDKAHVEAKFPRASQTLVIRLGQALSQRRQYFRYRESHHEKLARGLFDSGRSEAGAQSTVASSIPRGMRVPGTTPVFGELDEDERSDTGFSQTSFATTAPDSERLRIPPLPKKSNDGPFECPFCFMLIFCESEYATEADLRKHVTGNHGPITEMELNTVIARCGRNQSLSTIFPVECPLCCDTLQSVQQYQRHIGRHQVDLALFALPRINDDEPDERSEDQDATSIHSGSNSEVFSDDISAAESIASAEIANNTLGERFAVDKTGGKKATQGRVLTTNAVVGETMAEYDNSVDNEIKRIGRELANLAREDAQLRNNAPATQPISAQESEQTTVSGPSDSELSENNRGRYGEANDRRGYIQSSSPNHSREPEGRDMKDYGELEQLVKQKIDLEWPKDEELVLAEMSRSISGRNMSILLDENIEELENGAREKQKRDYSYGDSSPPLLSTSQGIGGSTIEREVVTHYEDVEHGVVRVSPPTPPINPDDGRFVSSEVGSSEESWLQEVNKVPLQEKLNEDSRPNDKDAEAVEEYRKVEAEQLLEENEKIKKRDEEYKRRMQEQLLKSGLSEEEINSVLKGKKGGTKNERKGKGKEEDSVVTEDNSRPTYTRMARRHLSLETLRVYNIDYVLDQVSIQAPVTHIHANEGVEDPEYVLIKRWVPEPEQDILWKHTRVIRQQRIGGHNSATQDDETESNRLDPEWVRKKKT
ncbi:hypothetical protein O1611_g3836 [Lasiodiplodia mahajangana]|uniref:Uncharacterized protein n=1 Tax=Lasiodiplodia mahajangana TaxID=1108764 RepID=A0ACC2JQM9_9PEZI|nr:hypothetical protein O1611_g3836 [Lasiodiplodia mahajangana]